MTNCGLEVYLLFPLLEVTGELLEPGTAKSGDQRLVELNGDSAGYTREETIVVYVWEAATPLPETSGEAVDPRLSRDFAASGLDAMAMLHIWQKHLADSIRSGYPVSESWVGADRERADFALRRAALTTSTDADHIALRAIVNQFENLRRWSDGLLEANRNLRLAEYYMSPAALENDPLYQKTAACGSFLTSMLASGRLAADASCQ